jgi:hypothetical protein
MKLWNPSALGATMSKDVAAAIHGLLNDKIQQATELEYAQETIACDGLPRLDFLNQLVCDPNASPPTGPLVLATRKNGRPILISRVQGIGGVLPALILPDGGGVPMSVPGTSVGTVVSIGDAWVIDISETTTCPVATGETTFLTNFGTLITGSPTEGDTVEVTALCYGNGSILATAIALVVSARTIVVGNSFLDLPDGYHASNVAYSDHEGDPSTWVKSGSRILEDNSGDHTLEQGGYGIATNGTRLVIVGFGATDTIAYSDDNGLTWTGCGKVFSVAGRAVAWNGLMFVAVGIGTVSIASSTDGETWTPTSYYSGTSDTAIEIAEGSGWTKEFGVLMLVRWVIGDDVRAESAANPSNYMRGLVVGVTENTLSIAVTESAGSGTHADWRFRQANPFCGGEPTGSAYAVAWNGTTRWAIVGGSGDAGYSTDGLWWKRGSVGSGLLSTGTVAGLVWSGSFFVGVGKGPSNTIVYSADGDIWIGAGDAVLEGGGRGVALMGTRLIATGKGANSIAYSDDGGMIWHGEGDAVWLSSGYGTGGGGWGVAWDGVRVLIVGSGPFNGYFSTDGETWSPSIGEGTFEYFARAVASRPAPSLFPPMP